MAQKANTTIKEWPGAFGVYKRSKEAVLVNIDTFLLLAVIYLAVSIVSWVVLSSFGVKDNSPLQNIVDLVVGSAVTVSFTLMILASIRGQRMDIGSSLKGSLSTVTLKMILLSFLTVTIALMSLLLLIVPFFVIVPRISLAPYFLVDKNMGVFESIGASWTVTKGSLGKLWGLIGVSILFGIAILVLVGIYFSIMYAASFGLLYTYLTSQHKTASK